MTCMIEHLLRFTVQEEKKSNDEIALQQWK